MAQWPPPGAVEITPSAGTGIVANQSSGIVGDASRLFGRGIDNMQAGVGALGEWIGGDSMLGRAGTALRESNEQEAAAITRELTPEQQRADRASLIPSWSVREGEPLPENPLQAGLGRYLMGMVAESAPSLVAGAGGGMALRGAGALAGARSAAAGSRLFTGGAMATEGTLEAGSAVQGVRNQVEAYARRELGGNASPEQVRARTDELMAGTDRWVAASAGLASGALGGWALGRLVGGNTPFAGRGVLARMGGAGALEGGTEALQSAVTESGSQLGAMPVTGESFDWRRAGLAAAEGAVGGFAMGAPFGLFSRMRAADNDVPPELRTAADPAPSSVGGPAAPTSSPPVAPSGPAPSFIPPGAAPPSFVPPGTPAPQGPPAPGYEPIVQPPSTAPAFVPSGARQQPPAFIPPVRGPAPQAQYPETPSFVPPGTLGPAPAYVPPSVAAPPAPRAKPNAKVKAAQATRAAAPPATTTVVPRQGATVGGAAAVVPPGQAVAAAPAGTSSTQQPAPPAPGLDLDALTRRVAEDLELSQDTPTRTLAERLDITPGEAAKLRRHLQGIKPSAFNALRPPTPALTDPLLGMQTKDQPAAAPAPTAPAPAPAPEQLTPAQKLKAQGAKNQTLAVEAKTKKQAAKIDAIPGTKASPEALKAAKTPDQAEIDRQVEEVKARKRAEAEARRKDLLAARDERRKTTKLRWDGRRDARSKAAAQARAEAEAVARRAERRKAVKARWDARNAARVAKAAQATNPSPTPAQAKAGNYAQGSVKLHGLSVRIETPKDATRSGVDQLGNKWSVKMPAHYGRVEGTKGADGDQVDVYLGDNPDQGSTVWVVDQADADTGKFDEHKAFVGFDSQQQVEQTYDAAFNDGRGPQRRRHVTQMTMAEFQAWLEKGDTSKPLQKKAGTTVGAKMSDVAARRAARAAEKAKLDTSRPNQRMKGQVATVELTPEQEAEQATKRDAKQRADIREAMSEDRQRRGRADPGAATDEQQERQDVASEIKEDAEAGFQEEADTSAGLTQNLETLRKTQKEGLAAGSNMTRRMAAEVNEILNDAEDLSPLELRARALAASDRIGRKRPGPGAPWTFDTLRHYVVEQVKIATERRPALERLLRQLGRINMKRKLTPAETTRANAIVTLLSDDKVAAMKKIADALDGVPVPVNAKGVAVGTKHRALLRRRNTTAQMLAGRTLTGDEALDVLGQLSGAHPHGPVWAALAAKLRAALPADTTVRFVSRAELTAMGEPESTAGMYNDGSNEILIATDSGNDAGMTLMHELVHAATVHAVQGDADLRADMQGLLDVVRSAAGRTKSEGGATASEVFAYELSSVEEFMAAAMTDPRFQRFLMSNTLPQGFGSQLMRGKVGQMWRKFVGIVARALGVKIGSNEYTLLDAAVRYTGGVMEASAESRSIERALTGEVYRARLRAGVSAAVDRADLSGAGDTAFRGVLAVRRTDQIVRDYAKLFREGTLRAYQAAETAINRAANQFRDKHSATVENALDFLRTQDGSTKLAPLMVRATAAGVHPDKPITDAANKHATSAEARAVHAQLAREYAALSDKGKATYAAVRDYFAETRRDEIDALFSRALSAVAPDATPQQLATIRQQVSTKKGLDALIEADDAALDAMGVKQEALRDKAVRRALGRIRGMAYVPGPYFPLRRFGNYVVEYKIDDYRSDPMSQEEAARFIADNPGGGLKMVPDGAQVRVQGLLRGFEMFDSKAEAQRRRAALAADGRDPSDVLARRDFQQIDNVTSHLQLAALDGAIDRNPKLAAAGATLKQTLRSALVEYLPDVRAAQVADRLRRENVAGASDDMARVLAQHFQQTPDRYGYLKEGLRRDEALQDLREQTRSEEMKRNGRRQIDAQAVLNELSMRAQPPDEGYWTHMGRRLTGFGYVWSLLSPSLPIVNTAQTHMLASSVLGGRFGFARASAALIRAQREAGFRGIGEGFKKGGAGLKRRLTRADFNIFDAIKANLMVSVPAARRADVEALLQRLQDENLVDHTFQADIREVSMGATSTTGVGAAANRFRDVMDIIPHAVDVNNRVVVAKAAFDLALRSGMDRAKAIDYAVDALNRSEPNFLAYNKARLFTTRGPLRAMAAPIMQFKQGGQHLWDLIAVSMRDSIRSSDPAVRREAQRTLAYIALTHSAMAGVLTLAAAEPVRWLMGAWSLLSGDEEPWDYQAAARRWMADHMGPEAAEIAARGLPRAIGIDVSQRLGIGGALNLPELRKFDRDSLAKAVGEFIMGPAGANVTTAARGITALMTGGDAEKALQDALPRIARDVVKAVDLSDGGTTDGRGRPVPIGDQGPWGTLLQGLGFRPAQVAEAQEQRSAIYAERARATSGARKILDAYARAKDPAARAEARARVAEWNRENPAWRITQERLLRAQQERLKRERLAPGTGGIPAPSDAAQAAALRRAGSFATVGTN